MFKSLCKNLLDYLYSAFFQYELPSMRHPQWPEGNSHFSKAVDEYIVPCLPHQLRPTVSPQIVSPCTNSWITKFVSFRCHEAVDLTHCWPSTHPYSLDLWPMTQWPWGAPVSRSKLFTGAQYDFWILFLSLEYASCQLIIYQNKIIMNFFQVMINRYISLIFYICHHSGSNIRIYRVSVNTAAVFRQYPQVFMHGEFTWGDKDLEFVYNLTRNRPKNTSEALSTLTSLYAEKP